MKVLVALLLVCAGLSEAEAQEVKIGYTNIELVLAYMPEARSIEANHRVQVNNLDAEVALAQHEVFATAGGAGNANPQAGQDTARVRDRLIGIAYDRAEQRLYFSQQRDDGLDGVRNDVLAVVQTLAEERGYTHVIDRGTLLFGPDEDDITADVMEILGLN